MTVTAQIPRYTLRKLYDRDGTEMYFRNVVYHPYDKRWTWKPLQKARRRFFRQSLMAEQRRTEAVLRNLAHELLTDDECKRFKQALHHFRASHSVTTLCQQLKSIINSTEKILLLVELSSRIPKSLQEDFHQLCSLQYEKYDVYLRIFTRGNSLNVAPRVIAQDSSGSMKIVSRGSQKNLMKFENYNSVEQQSIPSTSMTSGFYSEHDDYKSEDSPTPQTFFSWNQSVNSQHPALDLYKNYQNKAWIPSIKRVFLERKDDGSLGLGIRGGREYGTDIYIQKVEKGGQAAQQGLRSGDKILEVNGTDFTDTTHAEAVTLMRNAWNLIMMIQSLDRASTIEGLYGRDILQEEEIELVMFPDTDGKMGCMTHRPQHTSSLIVKQLDPSCAAYKAGIMIGDNIVKIDGVSVGDLSEKQISALIRGKRVIVTVRRMHIMGDTAKLDKIDKSINTESWTAKKDFEFTPKSAATIGEVFTHDSPGLKHFSDDHYTPLSEIPPEKQRRVNGSVPSLELSRVEKGISLKQKKHQSRSTEDILGKENLSRFPKSGKISVPQTSSHGTQTNGDENWLLSSRPHQTRYTQRKDYVRSYSSHTTRSKIDSQDNRRSRSHSRESAYNIKKGTFIRYQRSRSQSPIPSIGRDQSVQEVKKQTLQEEEVLQALQHGLDKRQRAIRLSLYQMPDPTDFEWEIY
ncbi:hypothetical protein ScPMuIL_007525 [Solemya velum]